MHSKICSNEKCEVTEDDCKQISDTIPKGGFCGCCGACITQLGPGAFCGTRFRGVPPTTECGEGLECVENYCAFKDYGCYDSSESTDWE
ncbi:hypothetical protein JTE90_001753 [Oedothorax gibbosus]|uniref:IGFBP N-terminal domain-containing protein n=1 Tax=Oedothorax gibbosus TaxID=931172 RepID=A0AAV6TKP1_9ARAC|nr:hypothetical protein JTE90_001753 [Oedothorax gibbosus]